MAAKHHYNELSIEELDGRIREMRQGLFNLRVRNTTKELANVAQIRQERRELARAMTELNKKKNQAANA